MKKSIIVGAYGWRHEHWHSTFYPDDIPLDAQDEDWLLTYYSNEFDTVLVPAAYWCTGEKIDCEQWLEDVHEDFQFYTECHSRIFECLPMSDWVENIIKLKPQLRGVVISDEDSELDTGLLYHLLDEFDITVWGAGMHGVWRQNDHRLSGLAIVENELTDLRQARDMVEEFVQTSGDALLAAIIVKHAKLLAADLTKFRSMSEIMGH